VEIWEVSMTGPNMIFKAEPLTTFIITSICPLRDGHRLLVGSSDGTVRMQNMEDLGSSQPAIQDVTDRPEIIEFSPSGKMVATRSRQRDGHRLLVGSGDGTVRMRNMEDLGSSQPVIQDVTDRPEIIGFSPSRKMVATRSRQSDYIELRDTATWEVVGSTDVEYKDWIKVAFSADDKWIAVLTVDYVTICDIMHLEKRLSFDPWPKGRHVWKAAFQTCNDLVICTRSKDEIPCLLQVWQLKDDSEC